MQRSNDHFIKKPAEICFIAPTAQLAETAKNIIGSSNKNIEIYVAALDDALTLGTQLVKNGASILISRKGTKTLLEKRLNAHIVGISTSIDDFVKQFHELKNVKGPVAFFDYEKPVPNLNMLCELVGINARFYTYTDFDTCRDCVLKAMSDGVVFGVGGAVSADFCTKLKLPHITIENTEESIAFAIDTAEQILMVQKEEMKKNEKDRLLVERYSAVLNFTHDAIIGVDEQGKISVINPVAEKFVKVKSKDVIGKSVETVLPNSRLGRVLKSGEKEVDDLMDINGTIVSTNRVPIIINEQVKGAVATFQDVKTIQEREHKIRLDLYKKGHIAKYTFNDILGNTEKIKETIEIAKSYSRTSSTVLIYGETGTGKELFAQSIHNDSPRKDRPFVAINCAALSENLLESQLFGYEEGAFTGAAKGGKAGLFEIAHTGTIFLDEISEIPVETQAHLLRVLQEKEIRRIGSDKMLPIDVRVICATNRDLNEIVSSSRFRKDLFYRLNVLKLTVPPLCERGEDIWMISHRILEKIDMENFNKFLPSYDAALRELDGYSWPGNVRELVNALERLHALLMGGHKGFIDKRLLVENIKHDYLSDSRSFEVERVVKALRNNAYSKTKTARELGISRSTLWKKMKDFNL